MSANTYKHEGEWGWKLRVDLGDYGYLTKEEAEKAIKEAEEYINKKYPQQ